MRVDTRELRKFSVDLKHLSGVILESEIKKAVFIAGAEIQRGARSAVPVDTGALKLSITNKPGISFNSIRTVIGPEKDYGANVEFGQPRGTRVSPAALTGWAKRKGLNPYAVSKAIEKKGTKAQPFMEPAAKGSEDDIQKIIAQAIDNSLRKIV